MRKILFIMIVVGILFVVGCQSEPVVQETDPIVQEMPVTAQEDTEEMIVDHVAEEPVDQVQEGVADSDVPEDFTVEMNSDGFDPKTLTVPQGSTVTFINTGSKKHWPATDVHPSHTKYPGSSITNCPDPNMFDSCRGLESGEEFSFTFNEVGEWDYHDHLRAGLKGTIIVE